MLEVVDHHIVAEILLPRRNEVSRGNVVACSCDTNENVMGRSYINPNLDTKMY